VFTKKQIKQGEQGEIAATFDSKAKSGKVTGLLVVSANTYPPQTVLTIKANVLNP
jgi:hypothetical protein